MTGAAFFENSLVFIKFQNDEEHGARTKTRTFSNLSVVCSRPSMVIQVNKWKVHFPINHDQNQA